MIKKVITFMAILTIAFAVNVFAGDESITYDGSSTIGLGILKAGALSAFEEKTKIKFQSVEMQGSGKGVQALISGKVNLAGASRPLTMKEKADGVLGHVIAYDGIAMFINKDNPVKNLTKKQLKDIATGKVKNWKEVGGKNAPIVVYTELIGGKRATTEFFQEHVMEGEAWGKGIKELDQPKDLLAAVSKDSNGICAVSIGLMSSMGEDIKGKIKAISVDGTEPNMKTIRSSQYLISRPLLLVTKGLPKGDVKKFVDFMRSKDGQKTVSINFVPLD